VRVRSIFLLRGCVREGAAAALIRGRGWCPIWPVVRTYGVQVVVVGRGGGVGRAAHMVRMDEMTDAVVAWFVRWERVGKVARRAVVAWWWLPVGVVGVWAVCAGEPVGAAGLVELLGALRGGG